MTDSAPTIRSMAVEAMFKGHVELGENYSFHCRYLFLTGVAFMCLNNYPLLPSTTVRFTNFCSGGS